MVSSCPRLSRTCRSSEPSARARSLARHCGSSRITAPSGSHCGSPAPASGSVAKTCRSRRGLGPPWSGLGPLAAELAEHARIRVDAEARPVRDPDPAVLRDQGGDRRPGLQVGVAPFDHRVGRAERGRHVHRRQQAGAVVEGVRHNRDVAGGGEPEDLGELGDAAHLRGARLDEVHGARAQEPVEVEEGRHVLPRGERDAAASPEPGEALVVLRRPQGLLQPPEPQVTEPRCFLLGLGQRPGAVDVEHQAGARPGFLAGGADGGELALVQLDAAEPGGEGLADTRADGGGGAIGVEAGVAGQVGARAAAEEPVQRHPRGLARDVPQGGVHRRQRVEDGAAAPEYVQLLLDGAGERADPGRVLPGAQRGDEVLKRPPGHRGALEPEGLAPPFVPFVGADPDEQRGHPGRAGPAPGARPPSRTGR